MAILRRHQADTVVTDDKDGDGRADTTTTVGRTQIDERPSVRARFADRTTAAERVSTTPATTEEATGPRPRASMLATLSLIVGAAAAFMVLTGLLAGPGVAFGVIAAFLGIGGMSATSRRHVAGKSDALLGIALGLAAIVVGVLAVTGTLPWLSGETNMVLKGHDWLMARLPWLFPGS